MDEWTVLFSPYGIAIVAVAGGILMSILSASHRARIRELEIRERIAMIDRGMVPPPETDPSGFERRMERVHFVQHRYEGNRFRSAGIMVISVGFGLAMLLWFVGVPRVGMGLGGFLTFLGLGLLANGLFHSAPPPPPNPPPTGSAS